MSNTTTPLFSEEAEKAVLGSILLDDRRTLDICDQYQVTEEAFFKPANRMIFAAVQALQRETRPVDFLTARDALQGNLEAAGGVAYLLKLIDDTPTSAHAEYYIDIMVRYWRLRSIIAQCRETEAKCYEMEAKPEDVIGSHAAGIAAVENHCMVEAVTWPVLVAGTVDKATTIAAGKKGAAGISTGFKNLDYVIMGFRAPDLIVLAARPSMGKTSLAMNIAENVALGKLSQDGKGRTVGVFSLEMGGDALSDRMVCSHAGVDYNLMMRGKMSKDQKAALSRSAAILGPAPIHVDDSAGLDIRQLRIRARRMKEQHGIELLVIDYIQLLHDKETARQGRQMEVASISQSLKECCKELHIPILVLSQLSRKTEEHGRGGIPQLSDLRDSGAIEQDADIVWLLRRPCRNPGDPDHADEMLAVIDVAKQRNGPCGEIKLDFTAELTRFHDRSNVTDVEAMANANYDYE